MKTTLAIAIAAGSIMSASAAVTLESSYNNDVVSLAPTDDGSGDFSYTFDNTSLSGFTADGTGKLVLGYTSRNNASSGGGATPTEVTYGGVTLTNAATLNSSRGFTAMYYLDDVIADGDLVIKFGTSGGTDVVGFSLFALDGLVSGAPTDGGTSGSGSTPPEVILGSDGGFAVSVGARNNQDLSGDSSYTVDYDSSSGSGRLLSQHLVTATGGDVTASVGNTSSMSITAFGWNAVAIPEPSTTALLGLGGLALILRRRK